MANATQFGIYNMSLRSLILLVLFFVSFQAFAQSETKVFNEFSSDREKAHTQIVLLKSGALIVRLKTQDRKIEAYKNSGNTKLASKLEKELYAFNNLLVQSFIKYYNFSKVYFIFPSDYSELLNANNSGYFLNNKMQKDPSIEVNFEDDFFICEYGVVYDEDILDQNNVRTKVVTSTPRLQDALVIKDLELVQLLSPFPTFESIRLKTVEKSVENLNKNLHKFYNKVLEKNNG
jgi:hypothetical protein